MENELILLRMGPYFLVEDCSFYSLGGRFLSNYWCVSHQWCGGEGIFLGGGLKWSLDFSFSGEGNHTNWELEYLIPKFWQILNEF